MKLINSAQNTNDQKHFKRYSVSIDNRKMQIKTALRLHLTSVRTANVNECMTVK